MLTLLDRLARRGAVSRRKEGRGFRYQPTVERDKLRRMALRQFLEYHFDGSEAKLKLFLEEPVDDNAPGALIETEPGELSKACGCRRRSEDPRSRDELDRRRGHVAARHSRRSGPLSLTLRLPCSRNPGWRLYMSGNPPIDRILKIEGFWSTVASLRRERFDLAVAVP